MEYLALGSHADGRRWSAIFSPTLSPRNSIEPAEMTRTQTRRLQTALSALSGAITEAACPHYIGPPAHGSRSA